MYASVSHKDSPERNQSTSHDDIDTEQGQPKPPPKPAIKRFSSQWWNRKWDREVIKGHTPRILYIIIGFSLIAIWIGVIVRFAQRESKAEDQNASKDAKRLSRGGGDISNTIFLQGILRKFDADERFLRVQWSVVYPIPGTNDFTPRNGSLTSGYGFYRDVRAIYDANVTQIMNRTVHDDIEYLKVDNVTAPRLGILGEHPWDSVDTEIDMQAKDEGSVWVEPLFGYPWDEWTGSIVTVLTNPDYLFYSASEFANSSTVGRNAFAPWGVSLVGNVLNWKIQANTTLTPSCTDFSVSVDEFSCELKVDFTAKRPGIVIFCVVAVVIVNWLSTIAIFLITAETVLLRRAHVLKGTDILAVCFSALFALPTVRNLLPGAPQDFGAVIDLVGILPNVIIISLCTTVFATAKMRMRIQQSMSAPEKSQ